MNEIIFIGWLLIVVTGAVIVVQFMYFRRLKMLCDKYVRPTSEKEA